MCMCVCVCVVFACVHIYKSVSMPVNVPVKARGQCQVSSSMLPSLSLTQSLSLNLQLPQYSWIGCQRAQDSPVPASRAGSQRCSVAALDFLTLVLDSWTQGCIWQDKLFTACVTSQPNVNRFLFTWYVIVLAFEVSLGQHAGGMPWLTANTHSALSFSVLFLHVFGACLCISVHFLTFKIVIYSKEAIVDYSIIFCQK